MAPITQPHWIKRLASVLVILGCSACSVSPKGDNFGAYPVSYNTMPGWQQEQHADALKTFITSCSILSRKARDRSTGSGLKVDQATWQSLCSDAQRLPPGDNMAARNFFETRFAPYRVTNNGKESGLFTGYYEPMLYGSLKKEGNFKYPLYMAPADLKKKKPYFTQAQINKGALSGKHLELVWVDDPVMRFFLHIQGSGRVVLADGRELYVGYADQNGWQYESIGKVMGDEGLMPKDQINFFTLRQWLYNHPDRAFDIMERNPSYVFFKLRDKPGPVGSIGAILTPQRSLAVDSRHIPYGLPLFLQTQLPSQGAGPQHYNRIFIAQDTGGAIRGPIRGDIFFGNGPDAEFYAGYMKGHGGYVLLVPHEIESQIKSK